MEQSPTLLEIIEFFYFFGESYGKIVPADARAHLEACAISALAQGGEAAQVIVASSFIKDFDQFARRKEFFDAAA